MQDRIELRVQRSTREYQVSTGGLAFLDPEAMRRYGIAPGDLLSVLTYYGRRILIRVGEPLAGEHGSGSLLLDRFQRQSLRARLGEQVTVQPHEAAAVEQVVLLPSIDMTTAMTHHLEEHLRQRMVEEQSPVSQGMILFARFHHSVAGTTYQVASVEPAAGVVGPDTKVQLRPTPAAPGETLSLDVTFEDVGGLADEMAVIREMVQIPLSQPALYRQLGIRPPRGLILYGPPGTGKTHLARAIANELNASFYFIDGPSVVGTMYGETEGNLRRIFGEASHHAPSIILIDELDVLAPKRGETGAHSDTRVVTQLLSLMDGLDHVEGLIVVATTNRVDALDDALRRPGRFDREIYIGPPAETGRREILAVHTREMPLTHDAAAFLDQVARRTSGYVGADLREVCREAGMNALRRTVVSRTDAWAVPATLPDDIRVEPADFEEALVRIRPSASRLVLNRRISSTFRDVGGLASQKALLRARLVEPLREPGILAQIGPGGQDGIVLYGPSGCGKSLLAAAAAGEAGANFVVVDGPELFTKWLGQSEEAVRRVFELARRLAPTLLFFDQLDALVPQRSLDSGSRTTERVVGQLLAEIDDVREQSLPIALIAATNRPDLVDSSILRPGRFGVRIEVPLPSEPERREILELELGRQGIASAAADGTLADVARATGGATGADLIGLCRAAWWRSRAAAGRGAGTVDHDAYLKILRATDAGWTPSGRPTLSAGARPGEV